MTQLHAPFLARRPRRSRLWLALVLPLGLACGASAQIRTDSSLGLAAQTLVGPAYVIPQSIGRLAGSNLFHSFETFNILGGQSANFTVSTSNLANVISRVTGGTLSEINGQLKLSADSSTPNVVLGTPNFFFINPAGITFGAGASIDVPGAFHVSTANYIKFADGNFHADLGQTSTFSSAAPEAFGFLGTTRAPIGVVDGARLSGYGSQAISIVAGDIEINGGTVSTESGAIRIAAVGQPVQEVAFTGALPAAAGNLSILNYGSVYSRAFASQDAGAISISAGAITMSTGFVYSESDDAGKAGNIDLSATGAMWILDGSRISSAANWLGDAGSVTLGASSITVDNGYVYSDTYSSGNAARVDVSASADLWVRNGASISSSTYGSGRGGQVHVGAANITVDGASIHSDSYYRGNAGGIEVSVQGELSLSSGGRISSLTNGSGNAGSVKVGADSILIDAQYYSYTGILSTTGYYVSGNAGNIEVNATHGIAIYNGGTISSGTNGSGNAGSVKVGAGSITLDQGTISSDTTYDTGNAADVEVTVSGNISIAGGATISSTSDYSDGNAGSVKVRAGSINIDGQGYGAGISSTANYHGNPGGVEVTATGDISIGGRGYISSSTDGSADAALVKVIARNLLVDRSSIASSTGRGDASAANIEVTLGGDLSLKNGGFIRSVSDSYQGNAGSVTVRAESIAIDGQSRQTGITSSTSGYGNAGDVDVRANGTLSMTHGGRIASRTTGSGNSGAVTVEASSISIDGDDRYAGVDTGIFSEIGYYSEGNAGNINVTVHGKLSILNAGLISSSTDYFSYGNGGDIKIVADSIEIDGQGSSSPTGVRATAATHSAGNAGNIEITASTDLALRNGGEISASSFSFGNAGTVTVKAANISMNGQGNENVPTGIFTDGTYGEGQLGNIQLDVTGSLSISNKAFIASATYGSADAGSIRIRAGEISIDGQGITTGIFSTAEPFSEGHGGNVEVTVANQLAIRNAGAISSGTYSVGNAGSTVVKAGSIVIDGGGTVFPLTGISSQSEIDSGGNAGTVEVRATAGLSVLNGGRISSSTFSDGHAGQVSVSAASILIDGEFSGFAGILSETNLGSGNAGSVDIAVTGDLTLRNSGFVSTTTSTAGAAGAIKINAGSVVVEGTPDRPSAISSSAVLSSGKAGSVEIVAAGDLSVLGSASISSATSTPGNAGIVTITAGKVTVDGQGAGFAAISSDTGGAGDAGSVDVTATGDLSVLNGGVISSSTYSTGQAGSVKVRAARVAVDGRELGFAGISSDTYDSTGNAGNVEATATGSLSVLGGGHISSSTFYGGNSGSVKVRAGNILIDSQGGNNDTSILSQAVFGNGNGGSVEVEATGELKILNRGEITARTSSAGNAGVVKVNAGNIVIDGQGDVGGIFNDADRNSTGGNAGNIDVAVAGELAIRNGGQISSSTFSSGAAGQVNAAAGSIVIDGQGLRTGIFSDARAVTGNAGGVQVAATGGISVLNAGAISSSTFTSGNAGAVKVTGQSITIDGEGGSIYPTGILSESVNGTGNAGSVAVEAATSLSIFSGGDISSSTFSSGDAGSVKVMAGSIVIDRRGNATLAGISSQANLDTTGNAGDIEVTAAGNLAILNGGQISSSTFSSGDAGSVKVTAGSIVIDRQQGGFFTGISSDTNNGVGNAGRIAVAAHGDLSILQGGEISSSTRSGGNAGSVLVSAATLQVDGASSSINASAKSGSSGQTGNVTVAATGSITLSNGGSLSIRNDATVADPGTIVPTTLTVSAPDITLKDASITAASKGNVAASDIQISFSNHLFLDPSSITTSANLGNGGSIGIFGGQLVTLENSQITTSVRGQTGNGGDIVLNATTLILDTGFIQANTSATNASGGLVTINVQNLLASGNSLFTGGDVPYLFQPGVFGFNVIQAAAPTGLSGLVQITTPLLDVSGSLSGLSAQVIDTGGLARNPCQVTGGSSLAQTGRGGLPPSARGLLRSDPGYAALQSAPSPATETHARAGLATAGCL